MFAWQSAAMSPGYFITSEALTQATKKKKKISVTVGLWNVCFIGTRRNNPLKWFSLLRLSVLSRDMTLHFSGIFYPLGGNIHHPPHVST